MTVLRLTSRHPLGRHGFTLVEALMVIALIAVLVSLIVPQLAGSREAAVRAAVQSSLRSHVAVFAQYSSDWKDAFPYFTDPRATRTVIRTSRGDVVPIGYFHANAYWNYALADGYYDGDPNSASFYPPGSVPIGHTPFAYACCYLAESRYWNPRTRMTGISQLVPTRLASVQHPSKKNLISWFDETQDFPNNTVDPSWQTFPVTMGMVDGSARSIPLNKVTYGYQSGDGQTADFSFHFADLPPALHTIDGINGRDVP